MTRVEIKNLTKIVKIEDLFVGELFRDEGGDIYIMVDEPDYRGNRVGMLITDDCCFGQLKHFEDRDEKVTRLDGTISVEID